MDDHVLQMFVNFWNFVDVSLILNWARVPLQLKFNLMQPLDPEGRSCLCVTDNPSLLPPLFYLLPVAENCCVQ